jgi:hypothetical protein
MAMIVDVAGRDQCRDVTAGHGAVIFKVQLGPAVLMADRVPPLMSLYTRTGAIPTQQWWEWV